MSGALSPTSGGLQWSSRRTTVLRGFPVAKAIDPLTNQVPPSLTALGRRSLPPWIEVAGARYHQRRVFKNDFFAVTAMYDGDRGKILLKVHRQASFFLLPLRWLGRLLAGRECAAFERLGDVEGVPRLIERWGSTGLVREFIEGHPLAKGERVSDEFHSRLRRLVDTIHQRGMAYVDLEKCENVLVGDDGRPHLFDFQIAWSLPSRWGGDLWPARAIRRWLQAGDRYHLVKLQRRTRPDQLPPKILEASYRRPWFVRLHNFVTRPFTWCRRRVLARVDPQRTDGERGRVSEEKAAGAP